MVAAGYLWAVFTVCGSLGQTIRNAAQRNLIAKIGTIGATQVRFVFGLPFAILFLTLLHFATGEAVPALSQTVLVWTFIGALAQIIATALMLAAMKDKSFVVTTALIKTEAVQVAAFGLVFLHETLSLIAVSAIALATIGVMVLSWPRNLEKPAPRAIALGLVAGAFFAASAIGFRGGIRAVEGASFILASSTVLVLALTLQCGVLGIYMALTDRKAIFAMLGEWKGSLLAGFVGALASQFWFLAFSLATAASVRTLALIEVLLALALSKFYLRQSTSAREMLGIALVTLGVGLILWA